MEKLPKYLKFSKRTQLVNNSLAVPFHVGADMHIDLTIDLGRA